MSIGIGFDGGRHFRRRARVEDRLPCGRPDVTTLNLRWTDNKANIKRDFVPIMHLSPTPPARGKEGVVLKGQHQGHLVIVTKYLKSSRVLRLSDHLLGMDWEEPEGNVCWVEQADDN